MGGSNGRSLSPGGIVPEFKWRSMCPSILIQTLVRTLVHGAASVKMSSMLTPERSWHLVDCPRSGRCERPIPDVVRNSKCCDTEIFKIIFDPIACSFCSHRRDGLLTDHGHISFPLRVPDQRRQSVKPMCHFCVGRQQEEGQDRSEVDGQQCGHQRR